MTTDVREKPEGVMKYRKKPVEIEAMQWADLDDDTERIIEWVDSHGGTIDYDEDVSGPEDENGWDWGLFEIQTLEGRMTIEPGAWVIRGVKGEFYPCRKDIFKQTYEAVTDA